MTSYHLPSRFSRLYCCVTCTCDGPASSLSSPMALMELVGSLSSAKEEEEEEEEEGSYTHMMNRELYPLKKTVAGEDSGYFSEYKLCRYDSLASPKQCSN